MNITTNDRYEVATLVFRGFLKRKAIVLTQAAKTKKGEKPTEIGIYTVKQAVSRSKISSYVMSLFYRAGGGENGLQAVTNFLFNCCDTELLDLLYEAVNGVIEGGENVQECAKIAYRNCNKYFNQNKHRFTVSENDIITLHNKSIMTVLKTTNNLEKYLEILTDIEKETVKAIIQAPLTAEGRTDGRRAVSIRGVAKNLNINPSACQKRVAGIKAKLLPLLTDEDYSTYNN